MSVDAKIAGVVKDALARYPPAVIRLPVKDQVGVYAIRPPANAISYSGVEDFIKKSRLLHHRSKGK